LFRRRQSANLKLANAFLPSDELCLCFALVAILINSAPVFRPELVLQILRAAALPKEKKPDHQQHYDNGENDDQSCCTHCFAFL
jgi:hypothetical protein